MRVLSCRRQVTPAADPGADGYDSRTAEGTVQVPFSHRDRIATRRPAECACAGYFMYKKLGPHGRRLASDGPQQALLSAGDPRRRRRVADWVPEALVELLEQDAAAQQVSRADRLAEILASYYSSAREAMPKAS